MLQSLLPRAHSKFRALPLLGSVADGFGERPESLRMKELEPVDQEIGVLAGGNRGPPVLPALRAHAAIQRRADQSDDDALLARHWYKKLFNSIRLGLNRD